MSAEPLNIDDFVNYEAEYKSVIQKAEIHGDQLIGRCPFHDDKEASFTANLKTGQCKCFCGCIDGNYISFYAKLHGVSTSEAYQEILKNYGKDEEPQPKAQSRRSYTLKQYAMEKRLPEDFLKKCGLSAAKEKDGTQYVKMPYYNEENTTPIFRKRYANKQFKWSYGAAGRLILYGDWRLPEIRKAGYAILVEGESDTQSLWCMSFPALGCPGASVLNERMVGKLQDLRIYLHVEPDAAGESFMEKACRLFHENGFIGKVYTWSCNQYGVKDPSELFMRDGTVKAGEEIADALQEAQQIDLDKLNEVIPPAIEGAPVNLRRPEGWIYSDAGISFIDEKKMTPTLICRTPIILTKRLKNTETQEEKIEIAFKRDGEWRTAVYPRSTIFSSRTITCLADLGCTVTSENAKQVVKFLEALEAENVDVIEVAESASTFGWQSRGRFLPGHDGGLVLDIEPSLRTWANAYHVNGTFEAWRNLMREHRERDKFRFLLAASFAAPLLRILSLRSFFVYNWGDSKGGKTAALKAALSVWGDPERLMVNFNATQVALEKIAGFYNDLPLGIDERQLAGNKQESLEKIIYMIGSGTGRARGSKGGGLQELRTWRTIALATGEEPIATDTSQTGISTRILEIYGGPFEDERSASMMHQQIALDYGWAGPYFVGRLMATSERSIQEAFERMTAELYESAGATSGSHISGIAAIALADALANDWIFAEDADLAKTSQKGASEPAAISQQSWDRAAKMAKNILEEDRESGPRDVNESASQFIMDWILSNMNYFGDNSTGKCYGFIKGKKAYINRSELNKALRDAGYSPRKTMRYLADHGIISVMINKKTGKKDYGVSTWDIKDKRNAWFIDFNMEPFSESDDDPDAGFVAVDDGVNPFEEAPEGAVPQQMELPY